MEHIKKHATEESLCYDLYRLHDKETKLLADLTGIDMDLTRTINFCKMLTKLMIAEEYDFTLIDALVTAALVKYSRCFTKAVRSKIPTEYMASFPDELKEKHKYFINLRNKYIAHSVKIFEDNYVSLDVQDGPNGERAIKGVTMGGSRIEGLGIQNIFDLINLCEKLLSRIRTEICNEKKRLLKYYKSKPIDDVLKSAIEHPPFPNDKDVEKRKQWT